MRTADQSQMEIALRAHFRRERCLAGRSEGHAAAVAALAAAAASEAGARDAGMGGLVRAAVKFFPRVFWAAPIAVVALAFALVLSGIPASQAEAALAASGPVLVAACLAGVVRARSCCMQELEASCLRNAVSVACVRFMVFGGATFLALAFACAVYASVVSAGAAAAYALAPYLVSAAGGLMFARKASSADASIAAVAWSAGVCAFCLLLKVAMPAAYEAAALWIWAVVSAASALWCAREVFGWLHLCVQGGIAPGSAGRVDALRMIRS